MYDMHVNFSCQLFHLEKKGVQCNQASVVVLYLRTGCNGRTSLQGHVTPF